MASTISDVVKKHFTAGQAAQVAGLKYHDVNYWAKTDFIVPSVQVANGSSTCRAYSFSDLVALSVARKLREAGINLKGLRKVVRYLQDRGYEHPLADAYLVAAGDDVVVVSGEQLVSALKNPGQGYFVFALGETIGELKEVAGMLKRPTRGKASKVA